MSGVIDVAIIFVLIVFLIIVVYLALFHSPKVPDLTTPPTGYGNGNTSCVYPADCNTGLYCPAIPTGSSATSSSCSVYCGGSNGTTFCQSALSPSATCVLQADGVSSFCELTVCNGTPSGGCNPTNETCVPYASGGSTTSYCYPIPNVNASPPPAAPETSNCSGNSQYCYNNPNILCKSMLNSQNQAINVCVVSTTS